eukprot:TRINITY_DN11733_c0_g1_i1.p1 TRINITY_DN11733_c0_g1~~TRINITY_DN11733_c0_g1_i1.p1  ORF type:complete len:485 (+),score=80.75 TRINITY_DN11733_c0_g1_i1:126-1580(+)
MSSLQKQLHELLCGLYYIGREMPEYLVYLSEVAQPNLPSERRIPIIGKMFEEIPKILEESPNELEELVLNLSPDAVSFRLLIDLKEISDLLRKMSYLQLLHLTNNMLPPGPLSVQVEFISKLVRVFQGWTRASLQQSHTELAQTPLHLESEKVLSLEPQLPWELLHLIIELLKLPLDELLSLYDWIIFLTPQQMQILAKLLPIDTIYLFEIRKRLIGSSASTPLENSLEKLSVNPVDVTPSTPAQPTAMVTHPKSEQTLSLTAGNLGITIARHPPAKTVYQRILKPHPAISLTGTGAEAIPNLFVEATLIKSDQDVEVPSILDGNKVVRIANGTFATFKKLKILSTSQQQGTLFRIKFVLKRYVGNSFEIIPNGTIYSNPIEVFSHTVYLNEKGDSSAPPPHVTEVIPSFGPSSGNARVVILGSGFLNNPNLVVRFGNIEVKPGFHESGTLTAYAPPCPPGIVAVTVANDRCNFGDTRGYFQYC